MLVSLVMVILSKNQINFRCGGILMFFITNRNTFTSLFVNSFIYQFMNGYINVYTHA
jgi:hypothetical protein